ncbi:hypothetical protein SynWH8101_2075 [Synechococcus sp. WH 8101]|nr:hypothetical protein SynWH8101_2075 [Synechococcus sp. WH 8101]QNI45907.1 hypothetical protein SynRCC2555_02126 [Synechococcus sp. WH 8101]
MVIPNDLDLCHGGGVKRVFPRKGARQPSEPEYPLHSARSEYIDQAKTMKKHSAPKRDLLSSTERTRAVSSATPPRSKGKAGHSTTPQWISWEDLLGHR